MSSTAVATATLLKPPIGFGQTLHRDHQSIYWLCGSGAVLHRDAKNRSETPIAILNSFSTSYAYLSNTAKNNTLVCYAGKNPIVLYIYNPSPSEWIHVIVSRLHEGEWLPLRAHSQIPPLSYAGFHGSTTTELCPDVASTTTTTSTPLELRITIAPEHASAPRWHSPTWIAQSALDLANSFGSKRPSSIPVVYPPIQSIEKEAGAQSTNGIHDDDASIEDGVNDEPVPDTTDDEYHEEEEEHTKEKEKEEEDDDNAFLLEPRMLRSATAAAAAAAAAEKIATEKAAAKAKADAEAAAAKAQRARKKQQQPQHALEEQDVAHTPPTKRKYNRNEFVYVEKPTSPPSPPVTGPCHPCGTAVYDLSFHKATHTECRIVAVTRPVDPEEQPAHRTPLLYPEMRVADASIPAGTDGKRCIPCGHYWRGTTPRCLSCKQWIWAITNKDRLAVAATYME